MLNLSTKSDRRGFTLIELLVVISIIGVLSSVVLVSVNSARMKARDTKKQADFKNIQTALYMFYIEYGSMPNNYNPGSGACEGQTFYDQSMQELVSAGFLGAIPRSPGAGGYCYYNYGGGNSIGAIMVTSLEVAPYTTTGIPPSCRPWSPGANWCDQNSTLAYCLCSPY
ncbi:prepilin-type N-terminal cleavage/methylation domain-containing protein [Patescibacteria group bacterium]|nr:prepilin-type N-terminal cleavage/methylation domain-containing protein [Patescibacteria group bacterium]